MFEIHRVNRCSTSPSLFNELQSSALTPLAVQVEVAPGGPAVTQVVLCDPGTTTHSVAMNQRMQRLAHTVAGTSPTGGLLLDVVAPANSNHAPNGFYFLWLVAGNAYSHGVWIQVRVPCLQEWRLAVVEWQSVQALTGNDCGQRRMNPGPAGHPVADLLRPA